MPTSETYSARSATPLGPIRLARVDCACRVLDDTAADLRMEARMKAQIDPSDAEAQILTEHAEALERAAGILKGPS